MNTKMVARVDLESLVLAKVLEFAANDAKRIDFSVLLDDDIRIIRDGEAGTGVTLGMAAKAVVEARIWSASRPAMSYVSLDDVLNGTVGQ
jgi:hypothetical protein